jgi:hypothetical protein
MKKDFFPSGLSMENLHSIFSIAELALKDLPSITEFVLKQKKSKNETFEDLRLKFRVKLKNLLDVIDDVKLEQFDKKSWNNKWLDDKNDCNKWRKDAFEWFKSIFL